MQININNNNHKINAIKVDKKCLLDTNSISELDPPMNLWRWLNVLCVNYAEEM